MRAICRSNSIMIPACLILSVSCAPAASPEIDLGVEEAAIRAADARWLEAFQAHDAMGEAAAFSSDGVEYRMFQEPVVGPDAIEAHDLAFFAENPSLDVTWSTDEIHIAASGDLAIQTGEFRASGVGPDAAGRILTVWKKEDGEWKVWHAMVNPTNPPPDGVSP